MNQNWRQRASKTAFPQLVLLTVSAAAGNDKVVCPRLAGHHFADNAPSQATVHRSNGDGPESPTACNISTAVGMRGCPARL